MDRVLADAVNETVRAAWQDFVDNGTPLGFTVRLPLPEAYRFWRGHPIPYPLGCDHVAVTIDTDFEAFRKLVLRLYEGGKA